MQEKVFTSGGTPTQDLHNQTWGGGPQDPNHRNFADSAFIRYSLSVKTDSPDWTFDGPAWVVYIGPGPNTSDDDSRAAFAWNRFDVAHDRVYQTARTATSVTYDVWAGSHPMTIGLACKAIMD